MRVQHVVGDLINSGEIVIAHGCNTRGAFAAGVAGAIKAAHPEVEAEYQHAVRRGEFQAGTAQLVWTTTTVGPIDTLRRVFNLATQREPGRCSGLGTAAYWPVYLAVANMVETCQSKRIGRVAMPRIGCGIADLKWSLVETILNGMYEYVPNGPEIVVYTHPSEASKVWT